MLVDCGPPEVPLCRLVDNSTPVHRPAPSSTVRPWSLPVLSPGHVRPARDDAFENQFTEEDLPSPAEREDAAHETKLDPQLDLNRNRTEAAQHSE